MKSIKIVLGAFVITFSLIAICSFTSKDFKKNAFFVTCYKYSTSLSHRSLDQSNPYFVFQSDFSYIYNWTQTFDSPYLDCESGDLMCVLCFDPSTLPAGVSFSTLLNSVWNYFRSAGTPYNGQNILLFINGNLVQIAIYTTWE